jgi:DNA-binding NarL/FixJ family response regulator
MNIAEPKNPRRVLIASSHALFGQGLRRLLQERQPDDVQVIGMVSSLDEALKALEELDPDLVVVDYDDQVLNRDEFMARFVEGEKNLRVVLLSLHSPKSISLRPVQPGVRRSMTGWRNGLILMKRSRRLLRGTKSFLLARP